MSLVPSALVKNKDPHEVAAEEKLIWNPTLAVYGDTDVFVAATSDGTQSCHSKERHLAWAAGAYGQPKIQHDTWERNKPISKDEEQPSQPRGEASDPGL
ncbi:hypothetical protein FALBO_9255 [Fusarium albosuccineum]|uniref:Uncharacterized protein n=1 Tax=Fusarium albosuccineum TaxID=1237068 RepID=A0A8H4P961_9HYPO|nr:hypothetical protein FALBO_9255 [Fusarium albosuccineum]